MSRVLRQHRFPGDRKWKTYVDSCYPDSPGRSYSERCDAARDEARRRDPRHFTARYSKDGSRFVATSDDRGVLGGESRTVVVDDGCRFKEGK